MTAFSPDRLQSRPPRLTHLGSHALLADTIHGWRIPGRGGRPLPPNATDRQTGTAPKALRTAAHPLSSRGASPAPEAQVAEGVNDRRPPDRGP